MTASTFVTNGVPYGRTATAEQHKQERRGVVPVRARARALDIPIRAS